MQNFQDNEVIDPFTMNTNTTSLGLLPEEVQTNVQLTLEGFQGGFMRNPGSEYYYLKSSSMTMIFKESQIDLRIPQYAVKNETEINLEGIPDGYMIDPNHDASDIIGITEATLHFPESNIVKPLTTSPTLARYNVFKGEPSQWIRNSPYYKQLVYKNIYENIDLVYELKAGELKYEFHVKPGGDYKLIELEWLGDITVSHLSDGMVVTINTSAGLVLITDSNPVNFLGDARTEIVYGEFEITDDNSYGFIMDQYDVSATLIIDPTLELGFSTFLGGSGDDSGSSLALDSSNNIYILGRTYDGTLDFPTTSGAFDETHNGDTGYYDVFVTKLSANGSNLIFSTFLGGSDYDFGSSLALDSLNNIYITGSTFNATTDFPNTSGAYNETHNGGSDVFVTKLSAGGSNLIFSTFLGGLGKDIGSSLALDSSNNIYITGYTSNTTTDFPPTSGAYDESNNGYDDVFVTKLSVDGSSLIFSTFLGGSGSERGYSLALDSSNNIYITGFTGNHTIDFPTTSGAFDGWNCIYTTLLSVLIKPIMQLIQILGSLMTYAQNTYGEPVLARFK